MRNILLDLHPLSIRGNPDLTKFIITLFSNRGSLSNFAYTKVTAKMEKQNGHLLKRILSIDFSDYAGDDTAFKQELIGLMIENLQELQNVYRRSFKQKDSSLFLKVCHKVKTTVLMLEDKELIALVEELKNGEPDLERVSLLSALCGEIIDCLSAESNR